MFSCMRLIWLKKKWVDLTIFALLFVSMIHSLKTIFNWIWQNELKIVSHSVGSSGSMRNYVQSIRQILFRGISKADSFPWKKNSFQPKTQPSERKWAALHSQYEKRCFSERSLRAGQYCQTCFATRKDNFFPPMIMMLDESTQGLKLGTAINTLQ